MAIYGAPDVVRRYYLSVDVLVDNHACPRLLDGTVELKSHVRSFVIRLTNGFPASCDATISTAARSRRRSSAPLLRMQLKAFEIKDIPATVHRDNRIRLLLPKPIFLCNKTFVLDYAPNQTGQKVLVAKDESPMPFIRLTSHPTEELISVKTSEIRICVYFAIVPPTKSNTDFKCLDNDSCLGVDATATTMAFYD